MIGKQISHYKITEKLGEGGMGVVYKAHDTKLDRTVALKFLPPHLTQSEEDKQRFIREAKAAAALNHPHICTIHSVEEYSDSQFISMEYIDGNTLRDYVGAFRETPRMEQALNFALQIAEALAEAHDKGIVHRDIKPENIMVDSKNRIKVMDFGLAKLKGDKNLTKAGSTVGTVAYMSPEQIQGQGVDHRSDIFSFGVVLYEMLTGQTPFRGEHEAAMVYSIVNEEPQPVTSLLPDVSPQLVNLIERVLEKDPSDRYQSTDDLLSDLKRLKRKSSKKHAVVESTSSSVPLDERKETVYRKPVSPVTRSQVVFIAIAAFVVIAGIASYLMFFVPDEYANTDRVMVAPFENRTGDSTLDPVGRMTSDWITQGILNNELAEVIPTTTMLQLIETVGFIGGGLADRSRLLELAETTESGIIISGMFHQVGEDIQFHAQIIDAQRNDVILTLDPVRGSRSEPMKAIGELQQKIMGALAIHVYPDTDLRMIGDPPVYQAYAEYMEGTRYFGLDYERAFTHYMRATEIDPEYMAPKLRIAVGYGNMGQYGKADSILQTIEDQRHRLSSYERYYLDWYRFYLQGSLEESFAALLHIESMVPMDAVVNYLVGLYALNLNSPEKTVETFAKIDVPLHWDGHVGLSWRFGVLARAYHLLEEHEKELETAREALAYFPEDLDRRANEANALAALGKVDELREVIEESKSIEPTAGSVGWVLRSASAELRAHGHKEDALRIAEQAVEWSKNNDAENKSGLANALLYAEQWEEAYTLFEELASEEPDNIGYKGAVGVLAALMGNEDEARHIEEELQTVDQDYLFGLHTYNWARINALLGEHEKAVLLIEESFEQGRQFGTYIHRDIAFEPLRDYPPFQKLLEPEG